MKHQPKSNEKWKKICTPPLHSGIPEKNLTGWIEDMEFPGTSKKNHVNFPGVTKNNKKLCGISSGLVFGLRISKGYNTILPNFQECGALICLKFPELK